MVVVQMRFRIENIIQSIIIIMTLRMETIVIQMQTMLMTMISASHFMAVTMTIWMKILLLTAIIGVTNMHMSVRWFDRKIDELIQTLQNKLLLITSSSDQPLSIINVIIVEYINNNNGSLVCEFQHMVLGGAVSENEKKFASKLATSMLNGKNSILSRNNPKIFKYDCCNCIKTCETVADRNIDARMANVNTNININIINKSDTKVRKTCGLKTLQCKRYFNVLLVV